MTDLPAYRDPQLPVEERVDDLLGRMTLTEKLAQLGGVWSTDLLAPSGSSEGAAAAGVAAIDGDRSGVSAARAAATVPDGIGQVTRVAGSTTLTPREVARATNAVQRWLVEETRLGIPAVVHEEALAGLCGRGAVQFPQAIGLAATWDPDLVERVARCTGDQLRAVGASQALAPVLDVARDPRWGRVEETYGEDPCLVGTIGSAYVRGLQSRDGTLGGVRGTRGVVATGKHFLGYAASDGGLNHGPVQLGPRELREVAAEPFAAAIRDAALGSVMTSYASVDGLAPTASRALLTDLLRDELGLTGTVVADYFAVDLLQSHHRVATNPEVAAAKALLAGCDVELPALDAYRTLPPLVEAGVVPESVVDLSVRRVLRQKFELGLFESPYVDPGAVDAAFADPEGRALALRAARESIVLLTNSGVVPIDPGAVSTIAVIGPTADDPRLLQGDYHYPAHLEILGEEALGGPSDRLLPDSTTPLAGLRAALGELEVEVLHSPGCSVSGDDRSGIDEAARVAASADVAVVCLGGRSGLTLDATVGELRDATDLALTGVQEELLRAVHATGTPTVAVVLSGRVHTLAEVEDHCDALLLAWVPGVEGGAALAEVLLGAVAPSGRLPISLPRHVGQVPVHHGHRAGGGRSQFWGDYTDSPATPLHPFGYGLSTTTFSYGEPVVSPGSTTQPTTISVEVANTGRRDGDEVVQLYVRDEVASVARPDRQLVGFARVPLRAGESRTVAFEVHPSRLAYFDEAMDLVCEPGVFTFEVGGHAGAPAATASVELDGPITGHRQRDIVSTNVSFGERQGSP